MVGFSFVVTLWGNSRICKTSKFSSIYLENGHFRKDPSFRVAMPAEVRCEVFGEIWFEIWNLWCISWNIWWNLGVRLFYLPGKHQTFRGEFRGKFRQNVQKFRLKFRVFFRKLRSAEGRCESFSKRPLFLLPMSASQNFQKDASRLPPPLEGTAPTLLSSSLPMTSSSSSLLLCSFHSFADLQIIKGSAELICSDLFWFVLICSENISEKSEQIGTKLNRGNESIYLHRSGPLLENGLDRPKNCYGRYGFPSFYTIFISTVGVAGGRVCLWRFSFLALWVVVVDISQLPVEIPKQGTNRNKSEANGEIRNRSG